MYIREIERYFLHFRNCLEILNKTLGNKVFLDQFNSFISEKYNFLEKYKSEDFTFAKDQIIFKGEKHES